MRKLYRNFTFDLTISLVALALGIIMLPPFGIGVFLLNLLLAASIVVYFLVYLWDKLRVTRGSIFLLTVLECIVYLFVIIDLILAQFEVFDALTVCRALGIVLWARGTSSAIGMYINVASQSKKKVSLPGFLFRLFLICSGTYLFANPMLKDSVLNWSICILFFLSAIAFGGLAILFAPTKRK